MLIYNEKAATEKNGWKENGERERGKKVSLAKFLFSSSFSPEKQHVSNHAGRQAGSRADRAGVLPWERFHDETR